MPLFYHYLFSVSPSASAPSPFSVASAPPPPAPPYSSTSSKAASRASSPTSPGSPPSAPRSPPSPPAASPPEAPRHGALSPGSPSGAGSAGRFLICGVPGPPGCRERGGRPRVAARLLRWPTKSPQPQTAAWERKQLSYQFLSIPGTLCTGGLHTELIGGWLGVAGTVCRSTFLFFL